MSKLNRLMPDREGVDVGLPIAVGGIGGSGTRIVAEFLARAGIHIGYDLNDASDNLLFTLLFKRREILQTTDEEFGRIAAVFVAAMEGNDVSRQIMAMPLADTLLDDRPQHNAVWLQARLEAQIGSAGRRERHRHWGWKEPNTQIVCDRLLSLYPGLRYVHVVRNGFDMAFSQNQNQLKLWGDWLLRRDVQVTPRDSLAFWCAAHRRLEAVAARFPGRFSFLHFEDLDRDPAAAAKSVLTMTSVPYQEGTHDVMMARLIDRTRPSSRQSYGPKDFDPDDVAYAERWGYRINGPG